MEDYKPHHSASVIDDMFRAVCLLKRGKFLSEIGEKLGVTRERARQILNIAIEENMMTWQEYDALKNRSHGIKCRQYFRDIIENIEHISADYWAEFRKAHGDIKSTSSADRICIDVLVSGGDEHLKDSTIKSALERIESHGVSLERLGALAEKTKLIESPSDIKIVRYVLMRFKSQKLSIAGLSVMAKEYLNTDIMLAALGRKYIPRLNSVNPAADTMTQLQVAIDLGIITQDAYDAKGLASQRANWAQVGDRIRKYNALPVEQMQAVIDAHKATGKTYKQLALETGISYRRVHNYIREQHRQEQIRMSKASSQRR
jgi:predicted transcriptional regulator